YKLAPVDNCYTSGNWESLNDLFLLSGPAKCDGIFFAKDQDYHDPINSPLIFSNNNQLDFLLKNPNNYWFEPGTAANQTNNPAGAWVSAEHTWWFDPDIAGHSKLTATTQSPYAKLDLLLTGILSQDYRLFVETLNNPHGGQIRINYHDWQKTVNTYQTNQNYIWQDLGEIKINSDQSKITVTNLDGQNTVGLILLIPADDYQNQIEDLNNYLANNNYVLLNNFQQTAIPARINFDLSQNAVIYKNFPEYSDYKFTQTSHSLTVEATFTGNATQDEYAAIIYPTKIDLAQTPFLSLNTQVQDQAVQFWEMGLEIDENNDRTADIVVWDQLAPGQNHIYLPDFISNTHEYNDFDQIKIIGLRFHPHKAYATDMNQYANQKFTFALNDLQFISQSTTLARLPRSSQQIDLEDLKSNTSLTLDLSQTNNFYNPFDSTTQEISRSEDRITINSQFSSDPKSAEYSDLIIDTIIDLNNYPYLTLDLQVSEPQIGFYDLAFSIDSDYDNEIDQKIWVDSVYLEDSNSQTQFYDLLNLLREQTSQYHQPRLLGIEILPHKQYGLEINQIPPVEFKIYHINFYHEAAIQAAQTSPISTLHAAINAPISGEYQLYINLDSTNAGTIYGSINDSSFDIQVAAGQTYFWQKIGPINLKEGENDLVLITYDQPFTINDLALFTNRTSTNADNQNTISNYQKISPVEYSAQANITTPGYVVFKETYHPAWTMSVYDSTTNQKISNIQPDLINGWQQAYLIDQPGDYKVVINYILTPIYHIGLIIAAASVLVILIAILIFGMKKYKNPQIV
ncbi:hypothetical protein KJ855_04265, partial [Patescibacteria group bacterium]|nr:hypothetical protein [Patescibacteria group bacterium]